MSTAAQIIIIAIAVGGFILVLTLVRTRRLKERFAAIWLGVRIGMILLALLRPFLDRMSAALGIRSGTPPVFGHAALAVLGCVVALVVAGP